MVASHKENFFLFSIVIIKDNMKWLYREAMISEKLFLFLSAINDSFCAQINKNILSHTTIKLCVKNTTICKSYHFRLIINTFARTATALIEFFPPNFSVIGALCIHDNER